MINILFLDVDGVLNCIKRWKGSEAKDLDPECLENLKLIVDKTDCSIVITSTWRKYSDQFNALRRKLYQVLDKDIRERTPDHNDFGPRSNEIGAYLNSKEVNKFAILDDGFDAGKDFEDSFFKTDPRIGLTKEIASLVIKHFS